MPLYRASVSSLISWYVTIEAENAKEAHDRISHGYGERSDFNRDHTDEIYDLEEIPTDEEVEHYRLLHNADEIGINDQWNAKQARYYLELDDEWHEKRKAKK